ncbi:hypothetical protein BASA81_014019 [Batrachochytrium salamandrivorans]|nr:hypothetical protein BASA81_014019 [Batrachochytrium salamandrivorans]
MASSSSAVQAFGLGVAKENVGKMVKTSKARVTWQFAFGSDFVSHKVELAHSLVSGKVEIELDSVPVFQAKSFSGKFEHIAVLSTQLLKITITDTFDGFIYDLLVNNVQYAKLPKKTAKEIETLRSQPHAAPVVSLDFKAFTGTSSALLDGSKAFNNAAAPLPPAKPESFNPFDALELDAAATTTMGGDSDPFGTLGNALGNALPAIKLVVTQDHLIDAANAESYADFNILSVAKGALVELVDGDLTRGLPEPFEDYVEIKTSVGQLGKVAKVALKRA